MVFNPDIQPEILPPPFPTSDPILHPSLHKILDPSLSLHHKDPQSATCFKKKSRKRFKSRPEILHISEYKGKETLGVNVMGIVAAAPKKAFQCAGGHRDWLLNFTIVDYSDHTTKIPVSYFAEKPADLPPIEHEDVIILLGASHKFHPKFGWQLQITRFLNTQWKVIKMKQPKSADKQGEGEEKLCPFPHVQGERNDEQEEHIEHKESEPRNDIVHYNQSDEQRENERDNQKEINETIL